MTGSARMNAKISAMPTVVVNGSPIPSVTGLSPCGRLGETRDRPLKPRATP